jgi:transposase
MLNLPEPVRILLYTQPTDMRKGFDSLAALVQQELGADPLSGHLFVFRSRRGNRVKLLLWDRDGYLLIYKRLEQGSFRFPAVAAGQRSVQVSAQDLSLLLWGIDPTSVRRQKRYGRPA